MLPKKHFTRGAENKIVLSVYNYLCDLLEVENYEKFQDKIHTSFQENPNDFKLK